MSHFGPSLSGPHTRLAGFENFAGKSPMYSNDSVSDLFLLNYIKNINNYNN